MLDNNNWDKDKDPSGVAGHPYNSGTWEAKARMSWVRGQPRLHSKSKASLCYKVRLYLGRGWVVSFNKHTGREKFKAFTTLVEQASRSLPSRFLNSLVNETESPQLGVLIGSNLFFPSWVFCEEEHRLLDFLIRKCFSCILYVLKFYLLKFITIQNFLKPLVGCIFDPWLIYKGVVSSYKCEEFPCYLLINI